MALELVNFCKSWLLNLGNFPEKLALKLKITFNLESTNEPS